MDSIHVFVRTYLIRLNFRGDLMLGFNTHELGFGGVIRYKCKELSA